MFIVPYIHKIRSHANVIYHTVKILCDAGGEALWEESDEADIVADILEPNGLIPCEGRGGITMVGDDGIAYIPIDDGRTDIAGMYSYEEIPVGESDILCWRTFIHITDAAGAALLSPPATFNTVLTHICSK